MSDDHVNREQPLSHYEGEIPILPGPADQEKAARDKEKREESEYKKQQTAIQSGTLRTQQALVLFGLLGIAISAYQAHIARVSADQAARASDIAASALRESQLQSKQTLQQMQIQSDAMRRSAETEVSGNRAWIVPDAPPHNARNIEQANMEWHNVGKTPAIGVFNAREYFTGEFPHRLHTCAEMERKLKKQPLATWQFQAFVSENGRYEVGNDHVPAWIGQQPILIHGCIWYTDILSNTERSTEFFLTAFQNRFAYPPSEGISLFYLMDRPFVYR